MRPGAAKIARQGWLSAHKWLLIRRLVQTAFLAVFVSGPLAGLWITKGSLASSLTLDVLPLTDPLMLLQGLLARHWFETSALTGAALVLAVYLLVGGRAYCAWVCPINVVADFAAWMRRRLGLKESIALDRRLRYWLLAGVLVASAASGAIVWELVNPVTIAHRAMVYGTVAALPAVLAVLLFDLGIAAHGWCGHLCPVGAFYGLIGRFGLIRVSAAGRADCDNCMDCFAVCPERQVIAPALRGADKGIGPVIASGDCTNCGRCVDVCARQVFRFGTRFGAGTGKVLEGE